MPERVEMKLILISDTHNHTPGLPEGDVLIHAGDLTMSGTLKELEKTADWLKNLDYREIILTVGNHDFCFEDERREIARNMMRGNGLIYLENESYTSSTSGLKFYGSPVTPWFYNWAFNRMRGPEIKKEWNRIPDDTDVLVTHGPPEKVLDKVGGDNVGCKQLMDRVLEVKPKIHVFGHIHVGYGTKKINETRFYNASLVNEEYKIANEPHVIEI